MGRKVKKREEGHSEDFEWFPEDDPVDEDTVKSVAERWGVEFPPKYISIAANYNGGSPDRDIFDVDGRPECVFDYLLTVPDEILEWFESAQDRFPEGVFPFATDPFGNAICFDYRAKSAEPRIVSWDHEVPIDDQRQILPIAGSFNELLQHLYEL